MTFLYSNYFILFLLIIFPLKFLNSKNLKIQSIIILEEKIPKECGIGISNQNDLTSAKVSIVKTKEGAEVKTSISFKVTSEVKEIKNSNIVTGNTNLNEIIKNQNKIKKDEKSLFFKEFLIDGATLYINNDIFKISGPIDSKVRLEYLFCTGEMFHPKYEK